MRECPTCSVGYINSQPTCPNCGFRPILVDGFDSYAPELAHGGAGFKEDYFEELAHLEDGNFWFHSRNQLILWALQKYISSFYSFFEIGCGTGYVLSGISRAFPATTLYGSEIFTAGLHFAADRLPSANFIQMDARAIPFKDEFDVVGAFDVLEHIEEDSLVLAQLRKSLKPRGLMLLTVPQHRWLWSPTDDSACHVRRYTKPDLHKKIEEAGFQIIRSTSFVTLLLPAMLASRVSKRRAPSEALDVLEELKIPTWLNSLFLKILSTECSLIKAGVDFPVGGSRLVISQRR